MTTILNCKQVYWSTAALDRQEDMHGEGLLHIAAHYGHVDILQLLVGKGLDLSKKGKKTHIPSLLHS